MEEFECLVYVEFAGSREELIESLASTLDAIPCKTGIQNSVLAIDVMTNDDDYFDEKVDKLEDKYLTYSYILDIGSSSSEVTRKSMITELSKILKSLWDDWHPAVAECEYKEHLPYGGEGMQHQLDVRV